MEDFRCSVCGGKLEFIDKSVGLVKCVNCGNQFTVDIAIANNFNIEEKKETPQLLVDGNLEKKEEKSKNKKKKVVIKLCSSIINMLALAMIALFFFITFKTINIGREFQILEWAIMAVIVFAYTVFAIFAQKISGDGLGSIFFAFIELITFIALFVVAIYFAWTRYLVYII